MRPRKDPSCYFDESIIDLTALISYLDNFQHDPDQCTPGGEDGNFIMFARATSGDKRNNNKFSPCSLKAIEPVLNAKARSSKGCFTGKFLDQDFMANGVLFYDKALSTWTQAKLNQIRGRELFPTTDSGKTLDDGLVKRESLSFNYLSSCCMHLKLVRLYKLRKRA